MNEETYTTIQGDMWDGISYKVFGSTEYVDRLMMLNLEHADVYVFPSGITLQLPIVLPEERSRKLPPWKEVVG